MSIEIRCESCGKIVRASKELAGKRADCPGCSHSLYIPSPPEELEELPLSPENPDDLRREAELLAERRRLDKTLARDDQADANLIRIPDSTSYAPSLDSTDKGVHAPLEQAVHAFLAAMRDSNLSQAEQALESLRSQPAAALEIVEHLAADQIPPTEMADVPSAVYQGFLKSLRSQLG